jgi:hypothetical protein
MADGAEPVLQFHLEPQEPIEVYELTGALGSLARQYQVFAVANSLSEKAGDARLLVSSVKPGSIDSGKVTAYRVVGYHGKEEI